MCDDDTTETVHSTTGKLWLMTYMVGVI